MKLSIDNRTVLTQRATIEVDNITATRFFLKADYNQTKSIVDRVFTDEAFIVKYESPNFMNAERGNRTATVLAGALASKEKQHISIMVRYAGWNQGGQVVNIVLMNTGYMAGIIGVGRVHDSYNKLTISLRKAFMQQDIYVEETAS